MVLMQFGLRNPNCTNTNSKHMFVTWIVILRTIVIFLTHVLLFLDQNSLRRDFLWDSAPQNPKFHRLDHFSWCWCSSDCVILTASTPILNMFVTWIVILITTLIFLTLILVILWFYLTWIDLFFSLFFLKAKFKIAEMREIMIADYT